jgi:transposase-like protein
VVLPETRKCAGAVKPTNLTVLSVTRKCAGATKPTNLDGEAEEGKTQAEAAKEVGCTQQAVSLWEKEAASQNTRACKTKPKRKRGRRTRLSRQDKEEIFKEAKEGKKSQAEIAGFWSGSTVA